MKKLFVVVHAENAAQACRNAEVAAHAGANGVFLIGHRMGARSLIAVYTEVRKHLPGLWIGMNFLCLCPKEAMIVLPKGAHGLWTDNIGINEDLSNPVGIAEDSWHEWGYRKKKTNDLDILYFAGVAFKHQLQPRDLAYVTREAKKYCDVITTSGDETGNPPSLEKIRFLREVAGDFPLAIASGIMAENVEDFLPYADYFLVSTGISKSFTELDPVLVKELAQKIAGYR